MLARIKALCAEKGIKSIYELERKSGMKPRTIYRWGEVMPAADKLKAVADVLGVTVDELLADEQEDA